MGIIINHTINDIKMADLIKQFKIKAKDDKIFDFPVHFGGPVEQVRGFVLHSDEYVSEETVKTNKGIAITANLKVLRDVSAGKGPKKKLFALGYSGWGEGQLEKEIEANSWFTVPADKELLFDTKNQDKWLKACKMLGIDPHMFSDTAGHA